MMISNEIKQVIDLQRLHDERVAALEPIEKRVAEAEKDAAERIAALKARVEAEERRLSDTKSRITQAETDASKRAAANLAKAESSLEELRKKSKALESQLAALDEKIKARTANLIEINAGSTWRARR